MVFLDFFDVIEKNDTQLGNILTIELNVVKGGVDAGLVAGHGYEQSVHPALQSKGEVVLRDVSPRLQSCLLLLLAGELELERVPGEHLVQSCVHRPNCLQYAH